MFRRFATVVALVWVLTPAPTAQQAQTSVDPEFAAQVKSWTTKPEFMSPLVDHLPKKPGVPTPKDILGYHIGAPKKLTYTADQQRFFRALEKAIPGRVKTMVAGKSEEGRDILMVFISSEAQPEESRSAIGRISRNWLTRAASMQPTRRRSSRPPSRTITSLQASTAPRPRRQKA